MSRPGAAAYLNPYLAGIGLGLVLLATFVIMGRGLGATGAFSGLLVWAIGWASPQLLTAVGERLRSACGELTTWSGSSLTANSGSASPERPRAP